MKIAVYGMALLAGAAWAQVPYPGCAEPAASDFRSVELFNRHGTNGAMASDESLAEPVQFDLHAVRAGGKVSKVDVWMAQRQGVVKYFDGAAGKLMDAGKIDVLGAGDNGLMGIALHPDFGRNRWIYFWYSPNKKNGQNRLLRLARIAARPDNTLDPASEKILIEILGSKTDGPHSGGPMQFDAYGDLWITVGNNGPDLNPAACDTGANVLSKTDSTASAEWGPSNTANMRGGILRIHPDSSAKGYRIPAGNFGEYWAAQWEKQGRPALAAQYRDAKKVLPEIYVKGSRSNYSLALHPTKRWLAWGEVNYGAVNDEFNLVTHPVFAGYPYFHRDNQPTCNHGKDPLAPINASPLNSGVSELPPATPGMINNLVNVAVSGPIYAFDPSLDSPVKFPPQFHQTWLTLSWQSNQAHLHTLDTVAVKVAKTQRVDNGLLASLKLRNPIQARYGPDGALYVLNYDGFYTVVNPGMTRVEYVGGCHAPVPVASRGKRGASELRFGGGALEVSARGAHVLSLYDARGHLCLRRASEGPRSYSLRDLRAQTGSGPGLYQARLETASGLSERAVPLL